MAFWRVSRFLEVLVWRCRARLPNVLVSFLKYLTTARPFVVGSPGEWAIIREVNETVFALRLLETGGTGCSLSCEKGGVLHPGITALHHLHLVISDLRPSSVSVSGEAALRRRLVSRAVGGYSLTSDDPAPRSLTVFQSSRVARLQDASKAIHLESLLGSSARSYLDA